MTAEIVEFNPFKLSGFNLQDRATAFEIKEFEDIDQAKIVLKECTELEKQIEDVRTSITKPVNDMIKKINNMAKEVSLPVNEAKLIIKKKIVDFNEEQEKIKRAEEERIQNIVKGIQTNDSHSMLCDYANGLSESDRKNFIINTAISTQATRIDEKIRAEEEKKKRAEEQAKLDEEKKKMSEEQAKIAEDRMKLEQEKRDLEEQKRKEAEEKALEEKNKIVEKIQNTETDKVKGMRTNIKWEIINEELVPRFLCSPDSKKINELLKKNPSMEMAGIRIREEKTVQ